MECESGLWVIGLFGFICALALFAFCEYRETKMRERVLDIELRHADCKRCVSFYRPTIDDIIEQRARELLIKREDLPE